MLSRHLRQLALIAVLAGVVLRALTPLGYMPSTLGSGMLFELCPDQLPAGYVLSDSGSNHQHHHGKETTDTSTTVDQCQIGHLLFSAIAGDAPQIDEIYAELTIEFSPEPPALISRATTTAYRTRAPPA